MNFFGQTWNDEYEKCARDFFFCCCWKHIVWRNVYNIEVFINKI